MLINERDNVIIYITDGHKYAVRDIKTNENIIKYGQPIGHAIVDIKKESISYPQHENKPVRQNCVYLQTKVL